MSRSCQITLRIAPVVACAAWLLGATATPAETVFDGSKARVNHSNKLTLLTQQIASATCRIAAGIGTQRALADLEKATGDFNTILNGLELGGMSLGIPGPENYGVVLRSIKRVRDAWTPIDRASQEILSAGAASEGTSGIIAQGNLDLLGRTEILASDIVGKYSKPNQLTQADAMALFIAGRQRMLGARMSKEICGIATGSDLLGTPENLQETVGMYNVSLTALREGLVDAGVNPPPNDVIRAELDAVNTTWQSNSPALSAISGGTPPTNDNVEMVAALSSELMTDMSNVVTLYMLATPGQEDVFRVPLQAYAENELAQWLENPDLIAAVKAQNSAHQGLSQSDIDQLDKDWRAQRKSGGGALINELLGRPVSAWLRTKQAETASFVTEVFAMDNRGLNVAQSVETSDYWQGDEAKWQKTFGDGSGKIHISEVEFDESTGTYQSQASIPLKDPATGELIGAITFGINVQALL